MILRAEARVLPPPVRHHDPLRTILTRCQSQVFLDNTRFRVMVSGRRSGKTFLSRTELLTNAFNQPESLNWFVAPTTDDTRDLCWKQIRTLPDIYVRRRDESRLALTLVNGSEIRMMSAERSKRGRGVDLAVLDEFAQFKKEVWEEELRPSLADRAGRALFITTPKGHNWGYDLYLRGLGEDPEWSAHQFTTLEAGIVPAKEIEQARRDLDPRVFRQEFEASFETVGGRVYDNFSRKLWPKGNIDPTIEDTGAEILIGQDFNIDPMATVFAVRVADEVHVIDAMELPITNTQECADAIKSRYPNRRIIICPDPAGKARHTSAPVGQTDLKILRQAGFVVRAQPAAPLVPDRVNNTQAMLLNAAGRRRVRIHPKAQTLIRSMDGLTYKPNTNQIDKTLGLDHSTDAFDYLLWQEFNVFQDREAHTQSWRT